MEKRNNWQQFKAMLDRNGIKRLYHFTDRENLESIISNGGLYSWADCDSRGIKIPRPGGSDTSRSLDRLDRLQNHVRVSFTKAHPMMYVAMDDGRIANPVVLTIDPEVALMQGVKYADRNATKNGAQVGGSLDDLERIHFDTVKLSDHFGLDEDEKPFYQAEILVPNFIPLKYITNIENFGIPVPSQPQKLQSKEAYTAQITRNTPTAFIFLVDQSVSMERVTTFLGERMTLSEAVARIVNNQVNELVMRCIKTNEVRNYYDIAVIGYGDSVYSGWNGSLEGRFFVSPDELKNNPYKRIVVKEEKRTRRGTQIKEVEKVQWIEARHDGNWTHLHKALAKAKSLLTEWLETHHDKDCYPPTVINITDGQYNGSTDEEVQQLSNELKAMFTNDGNVLFWNIHITPSRAEQVLLPISIDELGNDRFARSLYRLSSLLPERYNQDIARIRNDSGNDRHVAISMNVDMSTLIQLMDIGTPTNISQNQ